MSKQITMDYIEYRDMKDYMKSLRKENEELKKITAERVKHEISVVEINKYSQKFYVGIGDKADEKEIDKIISQYFWGLEQISAEKNRLSERCKKMENASLFTRIFLWATF